MFILITLGYQFSNYPMFVITTTLRPRTWPAAIPVMVAALILYLGQKKGNVDEVKWVAALLLFMAAALWYLLWRIEITLDDLGFTHTNLLRSRSLPWPAVTATYLKYRHHGQSGSYYWYFENTVGKPLNFSISLYSRASLRTLAEAVVMKCSHAPIDPRIQQMAAGSFPWYIF